MHDASPAARALLALEVIQGAPGITADRLAGRLGVSERAVRRYVGTLREAGIPIDSVRGPYGGYRVGRGLRLPPLVFSSAEALGLVMAVLDGHHAAGDATDPVGSALGKLVRALPQPVARQAEAVRRVAEAAPDRAAVRPDLTVTAQLVQACAEHRCVRIGYRSEAGREWEIEAEPWAVVVRHGRWYLLCRDRRVDAVRAYRLDRVREVAPADGRFRPPTDLDPVTALEEHLALGWEHEAVLEIDARVEQVGRWVSPALGRLEAAGPARTRLVGSTSNPHWYAEQLAVLAAPFRVVGGPELRAPVKALAARLTAAAD
jgi:predicted DNA-binding transcriptional regulator YafY